MTTLREPSASFDEVDDRTEAMHRAIEDWLSELTELVDEARATEAFRTWLDVQRRFNDYSVRNTLLIAQQCPEATKVAGYRAWQEEFARNVKEGERAIWVWAPIVARRCPTCGNSKRYHERNGCEDDAVAPGEWSKGLVGFKPVPVFDVSQTEGEPLPELDTVASGEAPGLVDALLEAADDFALDVRIVPKSEWTHGAARGICQTGGGDLNRPRVEVINRENEADLATTLVHEYAHAELHVGVEDGDERAKREVEAEAVAYVVGRHFGLDTSNSAFYLAAWADDEVDVLEERLGRISSTSERLIGVIGRSEA